tara:strand:- start:3040 stop:3711 length:672 start_codon:yes stop_codon:yes gene_type:complete
MSTKAYRSFVERVDAVAVGLPAVPATRLNLSIKEQDELATVAVFIHAACEYYVEERCRDIVFRARRSFSSNSKLKFCLRVLLMLRFSKLDGDKIDRFEHIVLKLGGGFRILQSQVRLRHARVVLEIDGACTHYINEFIDKNHGVSLKYLRKMLIPLGFDPGVLDPTLVSALSDIARLRGDAAHRPALHARSIIHPVTMSARIASIKSGFMDLDQKLVAHLKKS